MTDAPQLLLAHHLKAFNLPTFLREYDKLARQCAAEGFDHTRYLLRLAELERKPDAWRKGPSYRPFLPFTDVFLLREPDALFLRR
jgi:hypothetical protein